MLVRFVKLDPRAVTPKKAHDTDAGFDLTAIGGQYDPETHTWVYDTGLAIEIPVGHVGYIFPRSSIYKKDQALSNAVGVVDSGYFGSIKARFTETKHDTSVYPEIYRVGERIGQLIIMPIPKVELLEVASVDAFDKSDRGSNGFGSSGA